MLLSFDVSSALVSTWEWNWTPGKGEGKKRPLPKSVQLERIESRARGRVNDGEHTYSTPNKQEFSRQTRRKCCYWWRKPQLFQRHSWYFRLMAPQGDMEGRVLGADEVKWEWAGAGGEHLGGPILGCEDQVDLGQYLFRVAGRRCVLKWCVFERF